MYNNLLLTIGNYLQDYDKIKLIHLNKKKKQLIDYILFNSEYKYKILNLKYYNLITKIYNVNELSNLKLFNNLTHLTFGKYFNQPLNDCLSQSLTHLKLSEYYKHPLYHLSKTIIIISKY